MTTYKLDPEASSLRASTSLSARYHVQDFGPMEMLRGMNLERDRNARVKAVGYHYHVQYMLERFEMITHKSSRTPTALTPMLRTQPISSIGGVSRALKDM